MFYYSCNSNLSQYKCPRCSINYCSLTCFKDPSHIKCTEKFYQDQIRETLKSEKITELSDEREKMIKILENLNKLDLENESESENNEDSDEIDIDPEDLDNLNVNELEELLGQKHLNKVRELIDTGVTSDWLESAGLLSTKNNSPPWFILYIPSSVVLNEDEPDYLPIHNTDSPIPDIKSMTKKTPSDYLWNNLLEICVIYSFVYFQFSSNEMKDPLIIESEVKPIMLELCSTLMQHKSDTSKGNPMFTSAVDALEAAKSTIYFNSSDINMNEVFDGVICLLNHPKKLIVMLLDMINWFHKNSNSISKLNDSFFAEKKLIFMASWIQSEVSQSKTSVDGILKTLKNIVEQFK